MKYRKKPVVIEAYRLPEPGKGAEQVPYWLLDALASGKANGRVGHDFTGIIITTLEGDMVARPGDWIIQGVKGELYPCKPDIFEATYEPAEQPKATNG